MLTVDSNQGQGNELSWLKEPAKTHFGDWWEACLDTGDNAIYTQIPWAQIQNVAITSPLAPQVSGTQTSFQTA